MPRYIDADIAHEMLLRGYVINDVPTADVQEVRHGRWIETRPGYCQCSLCKRGICCSWFKSEYCERCGAKMDGKE